MRRVNWTFAVALLLTVAAVAGGFHALHVVRYGPKAAELGMALYDWAAAIDNLDVLLRARPDDAELCEHYADCLYSIGKYVEAASWYERAVRADPKRVTAYVGHANVLQYGLRQPAQ